MSSTKSVAVSCLLERATRPRKATGEQAAASAVAARWAAWRWGWSRPGPSLTGCGSEFTDYLAH